MQINPQNNLYERCESAAEKKMLHLLSKVYPYRSIQNQVQSLQYRLDFVTDDGIAWEVDGKEWHNDKDDNTRDLQILECGNVHTIIRIPAGAIHWYYNSCVAMFRLWSIGGYGKDLPTPALDASECAERFCRLHDHWENEGTPLGDRCCDIARLHETDGYMVTKHIAFVGGALSFIDGWEDYVHTTEIALKRHQYMIMRKTP